VTCLYPNGIQEILDQDFHVLCGGRDHLPLLSCAARRTPSELQDDRGGRTK
jgi:hypothetical protein